jgi:hypothetical protein
MLRRLLALALLGLVLAAPTRADALATDPHFEEPVIGDCHQYGFQVLNGRSDTSAAVPCSQSHTAKVFHVFQLPDTMDWTATDAELAALVSKQCDPVFKTWMGRDLLTIALTAYSYAWFSPTQTQIDAGARWLRCDIIAYKSGALAPLTKNKPPMIPQPLTKAVRKCLNGAKYRTTVCSAKHQWRADGDFKLAPGKYPSATKFGKIAASRCPRLVATRAYLYQFPSKAQWKSGDRIMICYAKTTR